MDLSEADVVDPNPDIHQLFLYYNTLYFHDALGACILTWGSKRMSLCAGLCVYLSGGGCEIRLSEPLLKFRSSSDLKNTLLHEMIHAYLWIKNDNRDHSDHGPRFQKLMKEINSSTTVDHQRPDGGYNITIYHSFHDEVDSYRVHHWMCQLCGDLIKRAINRIPSVNDCVERVGYKESCGNPTCHWHRHKMLCLGSYTKIAEPAGYKDRKRGLKGKDEHESLSNKSIHTNRNALEAHGKGSKDKPLRKPKTIDKFFPPVGDLKRKSGRILHSADDPQSSFNCDELEVHREMLQDHVALKQTSDFCRNSVAKKGGSTHVKSAPSGKQENHNMIFHWETDSTNKEEGKGIEPNKKMEWSRNQKLVKVEATGIRERKDKHDLCDLNCDQNAHFTVEILEIDVERHGARATDCRDSYQRGSVKCKKNDQIRICDISPGTSNRSVHVLHGPRDKINLIRHSENSDCDSIIEISDS